MTLFGLFTLAVGLSMDAFAVAVCKGLAMPKITAKNCGLVGLWFGGFQALMPLIGYFLGDRFSSRITSYLCGSLGRVYPSGADRREHDPGGVFKGGGSRGSVFGRQDHAGAGDSHQH